MPGPKAIKSGGVEKCNGEKKQRKKAGESSRNDKSGADRLVVRIIKAVRGHASKGTAVARAASVCYR